MRGAILAALCALALGPSPASAAELRRGTIDNDTMKGASVTAPAGEPTAIVALISDIDGWTPARAAEADALAESAGR